MTRARPSPESRHGGRGQVKLIAGRWRGRLLRVVDRPGLRPTPHRVRETLFNWLQGELSGACVLDLFAGSGALGFEALSRGAVQAVLLEKDGITVQQLRLEAERLGAGSSCRIEQADAISWLQGTAQPFDLVFLDPPFAAGLWQAALAALDQGGWLRPGAWVYLEAPEELELASAASCWQPYRQLKAGEVRCQLWRYQPELVG